MHASGIQIATKCSPNAGEKALAAFFAHSCCRDEELRMHRLHKKLRNLLLT